MYHTMVNQLNHHDYRNSHFLLQQVGMAPMSHWRSVCGSWIHFWMLSAIRFFLALIVEPRHYKAAKDKPTEFSLYVVWTSRILGHSTLLYLIYLWSCPPYLLLSHILKPYQTEMQTLIEHNRLWIMPVGIDQHGYGSLLWSAEGLQGSAAPRNLTGPCPELAGGTGLMGAWDSFWVSEAVAYWATV